VKEKIGSGTFSTVRRGVRRSDKSEIAIKIITKTELNDTEARLIKREIGVMQKLEHENIVKLYDIFETSHHLYLIIEYCRGGELFDELINCTPSGWFSEREASQIIKQLAEALQYMHSKRIMHRDLKLENILIAMKKSYSINSRTKKFSIDNHDADYDGTEFASPPLQNASYSSDTERVSFRRKKRKSNHQTSKTPKGIRPYSESSHVVMHQHQSLKPTNSAKSANDLIHEIRAEQREYKEAQQQDEEEYLSDSHNEDLEKMINRRHSECISSIPHDLLFATRSNNYVSADQTQNGTSIIVKISDFGLSKKLEHVQSVENEEDSKENANTNTGKKKKVNILSKRNRKLPGQHSNKFVLGTNCGTLFYVCPEILNEEPYNEKVDMWSLGIICYVLLCGSFPFYSENELELIDLILAGKYDLGETDDHWLKVSDHAKDLIKHLLTADKVNRFSATQVLQHPFITGSRKLTAVKRKSVKWNAGSLLGKWPLKFRNILDSAKISFGGDSDIDSDYDFNNNNEVMKSAQIQISEPPPSPNYTKKIHFKINLDSPKKKPNNGITHISPYSDISELDTEQSGIE